MYLIEIEDPKTEGRWYKSARRETEDEATELCSYLRANGFNVRYKPLDLMETMEM